MMTIHLIREVIIPHKGGLKWRVCEIGSGCPVANALLSADGGFNIIYDTHVPSTKEAIEDAGYTRNGAEEGTLEFCADVIARKSANINANAVFVSTFIENTSITGWIGISYPSNTTYYNITLKKGISKRDAIRRIGDIGIILMSKTLGANVIDDLEIVDTRDVNLNPIT